jgi:hypothetical protein
MMVRVLCLHGFGTSKDIFRCGTPLTRTGHVVPPATPHSLNAACAMIWLCKQMKCIHTPVHHGLIHTTAFDYAAPWRMLRWYCLPWPALLACTTTAVRAATWRVEVLDS